MHQTWVRYSLNKCWKVQFR